MSRPSFDSDTHQIDVLMDEIEDHIRRVKELGCNPMRLQLALQRWRHIVNEKVAE